MTQRDSLESAPPHDLGDDPEGPQMVLVGDGNAPAAPLDLGDTGVDPDVLSDLALRAAYAVSQFNTEWAARQLCLPQPVVGELLERLSEDHLLDVLGSAGPFGFRYAISSRGRERAGRLLELTTYAGPAPVSLTAYSAMLDAQVRRFPQVTPAGVAGGIDGLVLAPEDRHLAGLAASSGRSVFVFGPPGNGKTALGRALHGLRQGELWIPYCVHTAGNFIQVFDPECHHPVPFDPVPHTAFDRRWVKIRRPLVVAGGEMTLDSCDLSYSPPLRFYEAPLQMKANGGTFLIDDFGRQRVDPQQLMNRWIIPLEHGFDYLTMRTGQKFHVPFDLMLIVATNLDVITVMDPAFLRRVGYRLHLGPPTPERYAEIFRRYAERSGLSAPRALVDRLLARYEAEGRELRGCEPRDLIERARDACRYRGSPVELTDEVIDLAWVGYFGSRPSGAPV
jgi:hypothetical protein